MRDLKALKRNYRLNFETQPKMFKLLMPLALDDEGHGI
jgi:hypothetical protein